MKKIFFIFLLIPLISIGQNKEITELRNEITIVKENLDSHHKQFKSGVKISLLAIPVTVIGILTSTPAISNVGGITSLFGTIIMIDSDKWFGKKYMNKKHKAKSQGYITEERINNSKLPDVIKQAMIKNPIPEIPFNGGVGLTEDFLSGVKEQMVKQDIPVSSSYPESNIVQPTKRTSKKSNKLTR